MPTIRAITIEPLRVSFAEAEVVVRVELDGPTDGVEVRGRLVGPRRPSVSTVEVAYPLRAMSDNSLSLRAIIPEPNLWSEAAPFYYGGRVEAWAGGLKVDERVFTLELKPATPRS